MDRTNSAGLPMGGSAGENWRAGPSGKIVLAALTAAAEAGAPCPSDRELSELIGAATRGAGLGAVRRLRKRGLIRIEGSGKARVATIVATGKSTDRSVLEPAGVAHALARTWTREEIELVEREVRAGKSDREIGLMLGRKASSVWCRANPLRRELREAAEPAPEPARVDRFACQNCGTCSDASLEFGCFACLPLRRAAA